MASHTLKTLLCIGLFSLWNNANAQQNPRVSVIVDYTLVGNGTPKIIAHLGNTATANLLVDTGASRCFISNTVQKRLSLPAYPLVDVDGSLVIVAGKQWQAITLSFLGIGLIHLKKTPLIICPLGLFENIANNGAEGLIGTDILTGYATLFDTEKHQITFWPEGKLNAGDLKSVGFEGAESLSGAFGKDGIFRIHARFNDKEEEDIGLDTGAALTALSLQIVRKLKLKDTAKGKPQYTLFGAAKTNEAHLQTLTLGKLIVKDFDVQYQTGHDTRGFFPHIGMDVLSHFRFLLDAPAGKLYLKPIEAAKPDAPEVKY